MSRLRMVGSRFVGLFRKRTSEQSLDSELRAHLQLLTEENIRRGMSPDEAQHVARREFGGVEQTKEIYRAQRGVPFLETLIRDAGYGMRLLRKSPGFAAVAVLTLAIAIAVNTVVFTAFNAVALRSLPVNEPDRLARVFRATAGDPYGAFSYPDYLYYREHSKNFSELSMLAFGMALTSSDLPVSEQALVPRVAGTLGFHLPQLLHGSALPLGNAFVSGNYFQMLDAQPVLGRLIRPDDDRPGAIPVAVLSGNFWHRQFHDSPQIIGSVLHLNGVAFVIVGVTPVDYIGTAAVVSDIWLPISAKLALGVPAAQLEDRAALAGWVEGRLKPGISLQDAAAEARVLSSHLTADYPDAESRASATVVSGRTYVPPLDAEQWAVVSIVMAAVALLLLIACANVAGLLLARSAARLREIALRVSLGATRRRLLQQLLTESMIIGILAGALALPIAWWMLRFVLYEISASLPSYWGSIVLQITPDLRIFCYTVCISLFAGIAFGLTPALQSLKVDLSHSLKEGGSLFGSRLSGSRLRDLLVAAQLSACLVLLISSALLLRGSQRALNTNPGFDINNVLYVQLFHPPVAGRSSFHELARSLEQSITELPDVEVVAKASRPPIAGGQRWIAISAMSEDASPQTQTQPAAPEIGFSYISANYFDALHIPIVRGRSFTAAEMAGSVPVAIVSEATARQLWPGDDPIGKRIRIGKAQAGPHLMGEGETYSAESEVIGVVRDVRSMDLRKRDDGYLYLPMSQTSPWDGLFLIRTANDPTSLLPALGDTVQRLHVQTPVVAGALRTMVSFDPYFVLSRIAGVLSTIVGSLGLLLACLGVYGMVSYRVVQRTHEIGIRMALGAQPTEVQALVMTNSLRPVGIGIALGVAASLAVSRILTAILFGLDPADAYSFVGVSTLLMIVAVLSIWFPARRATEVDPLIALRHE